MNEETMTPNKAKKLVAEKLSQHGVKYMRLTARTVGFEGLARTSRIFVTPHGVKLPCPALFEVGKELAGTGVLIDPNLGGVS